MMNGGKKENSINEIKNSVEKLLDGKATLKIKRATKDEKDYLAFEKIITSLEALDTRSNILDMDLELNLSSYEKGFYNIIDNLLEMHYGSEASKIIYFYLYERFNDDGSSNQLINNKNQVVPLNSVADLWIIIKPKKTK